VSPDQTPPILLTTCGGVLVSCGVLLMLERSLTRLVVGTVLIGNGANLLILSTGGKPRHAPILDGSHSAGPFSDPLPQAMILTAIVITLASSAFVFSISYRSGRITGDDEVRDDIEDRRVTHVDQRLRTEVREQRREFRAWSRRQRRTIRQARRDLRARIREDRRRRATDDPTRVEDYPEHPEARDGGPDEPPERGLGA
jgi:multicomponent Na+:H+ antiporter subunit C